MRATWSRHKKVLGRCAPLWILGRPSVTYELGNVVAPREEEDPRVVLFKVGKEERDEDVDQAKVETKRGNGVFQPAEDRVQHGWDEK